MTFKTAASTGRYRNRANPNVVVELIAAGVEYRIGEIRTRCCIYTRGPKFYARSEGEFFAKFEPLPE